MGRFGTTRAHGDAYLVARLRRAGRVGFIAVIATAVAVLAFSESGSRSISSSSRESELASMQRLELSQLSNDLQRLAATEDPNLESKYRTSVADGIDMIRNIQVDLEIDDPATSAMVVDLRNGATLNNAVNVMFESVESTVERLEIGDGELPGTPPDVAVTLDRLSQLDEPYKILAAAARRDTSDSIRLLRIGGRWIAVFVLVAASIRLFVVGGPLMKRLDLERMKFESERSKGAAEAELQELSALMGDGMATSHDESSALKVVERALKHVIPGTSAEMLLADSSMAHMKLAATNPGVNNPGCGVASPWSCPAVRRADTSVFADSESVRSCSYLSGRASGACSAVCIPVSFMGSALGVLHVTGEVGWSPGDDMVESLQIVAHQTAMRIGTLRSFAKAEVQASTDVLTGLPNRRATESHLRSFLATRIRGSVALADLDHFKVLNDTFGHELGDRALRAFADAVRSTLREGDWAGRWGGEEFVMVLPGLNSTEAGRILDRLRGRLAETCNESEIPEFTVSVGIIDTTAGSTVDDLVRLADDALYAAKAEGRNRIVVGPTPPRPDNQEHGFEGSPREVRS